MQRINLEDAKPQLNELIDAAINGETILIVRDDQQTVQLVPVVSAKQPRKAGSAKGQIIMSEDFDAPLPDFDEYMC